MRLRDLLRLKRNGAVITCGCVECSCDPKREVKVAIYKQPCGCRLFYHEGNAYPFARDNLKCTRMKCVPGWVAGVVARDIKFVRHGGQDEIR